MRPESCACSSPGGYAVYNIHTALFAAQSPSWALAASEEQDPAASSTGFSTWLPPTPRNCPESFEKHLCWYLTSRKCGLIRLGWGLGIGSTLHKLPRYFFKVCATR